MYQVACRTIPSNTTYDVASTSRATGANKIWAFQADASPVFDVPALVAVEHGCFGRSPGGGIAGTTTTVPLRLLSSPLAAALQLSLSFPIDPLVGACQRCVRLTFFPICPLVSLTFP